MNTIDFNSPTILTAKQYGRTITIELDHSDTSIDEVMDGFLTILNGLGYLPATINDYFKDKVKDIYDDEHEIIKEGLADDWVEAYSWMNNGEEEGESNEYNENEPKPHYDWDEEITNERIDIIGQNGNEGLHYEDDIVWEDERIVGASDEAGIDWDCTKYDGEGNLWEIEEGDEIIDWSLETPPTDYKGINVQHPHYDWDNGYETETNDILSAIQSSIQIINDRLESIEETLDEVEFDVNDLRVLNLNPNSLRAKEVYDKSLVETERFNGVKEAAQRYSDEVRAKHVPIKDFDIVDMETGEVFYKAVPTDDTKGMQDGGFANNKLNPYGRKPNQPVTPKVMGEWQMKNKTKKIVHTVKKGKIKDLKK